MRPVQSLSACTRVTFTFNRVSDQYVCFVLTIFSNTVTSSWMTFMSTELLKVSVAVNVAGNSPEPTEENQQEPQVLDVPVKLRNRDICMTCSEG